MSINKIFIISCIDAGHGGLVDPDPDVDNEDKKDECMLYSLPFIASRNLTKVKTFVLQTRNIS